MRLLIVDDDAGLRQSLGLLLTESGYEVAAEGDPEEGLARALDEKFDLVLCDVRMPKMDGLTFLRRYRAERGPALMVMMSAYGGEDVALAAMREGAYDYLHKPFRPDEVTLTLRKAEERERLRREVEQLRATLGAEAVRDLVIDHHPARPQPGCWPTRASPRCSPRSAPGTDRSPSASGTARPPSPRSPSGG